MAGPGGTERQRQKWDRALSEHRAAADRYLQTLGRIDDELWGRPWKPGGWAPSQITHHLILYYEAAAAVVRGDLEMRYRVGPAWRSVLRWFLVPHILFHGNFPLPAIAPREVRPQGEPPPRAEAAELLQQRTATAQSLLSGVRDDSRLRLRHPYFGPLPPLRFLRLSTVHMDHHRRQVEAVLPEATA